MTSGNEGQVLGTDLSESALPATRQGAYAIPTSHKRAARALVDLVYLDEVDRAHLGRLLENES